MTVYEGPQNIIYNNFHFLYMIKGSCIQRVHSLILSTSRLIPFFSGRYTGIEEEEDDGVPFEEKMERLTNQFFKLQAKSTELDKKISQSLHMLGFGE